MPYTIYHLGGFREEKNLCLHQEFISLPNQRQGAFVKAEHLLQNFSNKQLF